jgi:hypothetical protein
MGIPVGPLHTGLGRAYFLRYVRLARLPCAGRAPGWRNGIRGGLKNLWEQSLASSSLAPGTSINTMVYEDGGLSSERPLFVVTVLLLCCFEGFHCRKYRCAQSGCIRTRDLNSAFFTASGMTWRWMPAWPLQHGREPSRLSSTSSSGPRTDSSACCGNQTWSQVRRLSRYTKEANRSVERRGRSSGPTGIPQWTAAAPRGCIRITAQSRHSPPKTLLSQRV